MKKLLFILVSGLCCSAGAASFTTHFPLVEAPISEANHWSNGLAVGLDWTDVKTKAGLAYGTENPQSGVDDDSTAILSGSWGTNQSATVTVKINGYDANILGEVEIRLNSSISAHNCDGYECYISIKTNNAYSHITRWNGALNDWTQLADGGGFAVDGDTLTASRSNSVIRFYKNSTLLLSVTDTTFMHGAPGVGFYNSSGTVGAGGNTNFGFSSFYATDGLTNGATNIVACDFLSISNRTQDIANDSSLQILPGSCTISNQITVDRGVSLHIQGSGTNTTTLIAGSINQVFYLNSKSNGIFSVSDLNCIGDVANQAGFFVTGNSTRTTGPFHFYNLKMTNVLYRGISIGHAGSYGTIDHVTFVIGTNAASYNPISFQGDADIAWTNSNPLGTTNTVIVEDCSFQDPFNTGGNGFFDGYEGSQVVVRHCFFNGGTFNGTHGYDSQQYSVRTHEAYNNVFTNCSLNAPIDAIRGGVFMFFSNTVYAAGSQDTTALSPQLIYYRGANGLYDGTFGYAGYDLTNTYSANFTNGQEYKMSADYKWTFVSSGLSSTPKVLIGATLAESLTNLMYAINNNASFAGTKFFGGGQPNFAVVKNSATQLVLRNKMDGTNASFGMPTGYPAAMQPGMLSIPSGTNVGVVMFPCYQWSNLCVVAGVPHDMFFVIRYSDPASMSGYVPNYETNLMVLNRDYFNDVIPDPAVYKPLAYPSALQNGVSPVTYTVTYNGNGNTGGMVPTDGSSPYASGSTVTVLDNTGTLTKSGSHFAKWNTAGDGSGQDYFAACQFVIGGNATLYAQYIVDAGQFRPMQFRRSRGGLQ